MSRAVRVLTPPHWSLRSALAQAGRLADYADLLATLSRHRINVRYKQSALGGLWAVLQPLAMMIVFTAVFSRLVRVPSDGYPYAVFAYAGLLPWTFFSSAVTSGTGSLVSHAPLVTKVFFPREILPISYVAAAAVDFAIGSTVLIALLIWFKVPLTAHLAMAVPAMITLAALALAVGLMLAAVQVRFRDVGIALPVGLQLLMFASPVLYPAAIVPASWRPFYELNPLAGLIETFRRAVLGMPADGSAFAAALAATVLLLPLAYVIFKRVDATVADVI